MKDKVITCKLCHQKFAWTTDQQKYYQKNNLKKPEYCPICRSTLKEARKDKNRGTIKKLSGKT